MYCFFVFHFVLLYFFLSLLKVFKQYIPCIGSGNSFISMRLLIRRRKVNISVYTRLFFHRFVTCIYVNKVIFFHFLFCWRPASPHIISTHQEHNINRFPIMIPSTLASNQPNKHVNINWASSSTLSVSSKLF